MNLKKHFVTFYSPGTFVAETTTESIDSWDIETAKAMAHKIIERYNAKPYAFRFSTRERSDQELDSHEVSSSPYYFLGGTVETLAEVEARATEKDHILLSNMRGNGYKRIITNNNSWQWTQPLNDDDIVLEWKD